LFAIWERNVDAVRAVNKQNRSMPRGHRTQSCDATQSSRDRPGKTE
jgi:hypothetical protein